MTQRDEVELLLLLHACYLRLHLNCSKDAHVYSWITRPPFHALCGGGLGLKMKVCWEVQIELETQISFQLSNRSQRDLMPRCRSQKLILPAWVLVAQYQGVTTSLILAIQCLKGRTETYCHALLWAVPTSRHCPVSQNSAILWHHTLL